MTTRQIKCARTACQATRNIVCRHRDNGKLYCPKCARKINEFNPDLVKFPILLSEDVHQIPRGSVVRWQAEDVSDPYGVGIVGTITCFVVAHHFDCDGTPLYHVAMKPVAPPDGFGERTFKWRPLCGPDWSGLPEESIQMIKPSAEAVVPWEEFRDGMADASDALLSRKGTKGLNTL